MSCIAQQQLSISGFQFGCFGHQSEVLSLTFSPLSVLIKLILNFKKLIKIKSSLEKCRFSVSNQESEPNSSFQNILGKDHKNQNLIDQTNANEINEK